MHVGTQITQCTVTGMEGLIHLVWSCCQPREFPK